MAKKHKYAEVIKAWADGAQIDFYHDVLKRWLPSATPTWHAEERYRVRPQIARPYAEVIKAWADGAEIQVQDFPSRKWVPAGAPQWLPGRKYRIAPRRSKKHGKP